MNQEYPAQEADQTQQFLLLCLRSRFEPQLQESIRPFIAAHNLDWAAVEQQIRQERIAPLVYAVTRDQDLLPAILEKQYKQNYLRNAIDNKIWLTELSNVMQVLNEGGVPVIALKGAALMELVYKNIALRPIRDLDLLIHREQGEQAWKILTEAGYKPETEIFPGQALVFDKEIHFFKAGRQVINLDLHWHLFNSKFYRDYLPLDWFWRSARISKSNNHPTMILSPEAQLLHLSGHIWLSKHALEPMLLWLYDIAALIYNYQDELDWDLLLRQTENCHLVYTIRITLQKLAQEWHVPVPAEVLARLETMNASPFELEIISRYNTPRSPFKRVQHMLSDAPSPGRRIALALRWLFPSPAFLQFRYRNSRPLALPFLYIYRGWLGLRLGFRMLRHYLLDSRVERAPDE